MEITTGDSYEKGTCFRGNKGKELRENKRVRHKAARTGQIWKKWPLMETSRPFEDRSERGQAKVPIWVSKKRGRKTVLTSFGRRKARGRHLVGQASGRFNRE